MEVLITVGALLGVGVCVGQHCGTSMGIAASLACWLLMPR